MMKRILALLLVCLLLCGAACAEDGYIGAMKVVNCQEWVSLREKPDAASDCLVEIPLGAVVENCAAATKAFTYGEYGGMSGYIMTQYLEIVPVEQVMLGDMYVSAQGVWTPMYLGASQNEPVIQWLAPGTMVSECKESADGFVYGAREGMKGYIRMDALEKAVETAPAGN
ncbi:MAG: hypothetical protein IJ418_07180 [Clostridia bacterium]|nr:hypothetical protein [Clostridia bacterium]